MIFFIIDLYSHWLVCDVLHYFILWVLAQHRRNVNQVRFQVLDLIQACELLDLTWFSFYDLIKPANIFIFVC